MTLPGHDTNAMPSMDGRHGIRRWALGVAVDTCVKANRDIVRAMDARDPVAYIAGKELHERGAKVGRRFQTR